MFHIGEAVVLNRIGGGSFGSVYWAKFPGRRVACAKVVEAQDGLEIVSHSVVKEVAALRDCAGEGVVELLAVYLDQGRAVLILEAGTPLDMLKPSFNQEVIEGFMYQMVEALSHVHTRGYLHCDVGPKNWIMVHGRATLVDFGIAHPIWATSEHQAYSLGMRPPEVLLGADPTPASDTWALGATLLWMLTDEYIFNDTTQYGSLIKIFRTLGTPSTEVLRTLPFYNNQFPNFQARGITSQPTAIEAPTVLAMALLFLVCDPTQRPPLPELIRRTRALSEQDTEHTARK